MRKKTNLLKYIELKEIEERAEGLTDVDMKVLIRFSKSKDELIRIWTAELLANRYASQAEDVLYTMTFDKKFLVRLNAVDSLCIGRKLKSLQRMEQLFKDKDYMMRGYAILSHYDISMNLYKEEFNYNGKYNEIMNALILHEKEFWTQICILQNLYLCGEESSLQRIMDILHMAADCHDYEVICCALHTAEELIGDENKELIFESVDKVYNGLLPAQKEYVDELRLVHVKK